MLLGIYFFDRFAAGTADLYLAFRLLSRMQINKYLIFGFVGHLRFESFFVKINQFASDSCKTFVFMYYRWDKSS